MHCNSNISSEKSFLAFLWQHFCVAMALDRHGYSINAKFWLLGNADFDNMLATPN